MTELRTRMSRIVARLNDSDSSSIHRRDGGIAPPSKAILSEQSSAIAHRLAACKVNNRECGQ
jgi:hypothetical protein